MTSRPNFFLLLDLDPREPWDQAQFDSILRSKRGEWSRQSAAVGKKALVAQQSLALITKIREVMTDPELREREAVAARLELASIHRAACEQFERQLTFINAKEIVEQDEVNKFVAAFRHLFTAEEIMSRLQVKIGSADDAPVQRISTLDPSIAKRVDERLQFIHMSTLYEFLQLSSKATTAQLFQAAENLYTKLVLLAPSADVSAKIELAGLAREIFKSDEMRSCYNESMRRASLDRLFKELDESMSRSKEYELHRKQVVVFLNEARKDGWQEAEALERLKEHVRMRAKRENKQIIVPEIPIHVRQASKIVITYALKIPTLFRGRQVRLIAQPYRQLPAALLLISKQDELPFRKTDGELLYRIERDAIQDERTIIDLPDTSLSSKTFGKLFFEDDSAYNECIMHHPGKSFMRLS